MQSFLQRIVHHILHQTYAHYAWINEYSARFAKDHLQCTLDIPKHVSNPINAFSLIRRLTLDLNDVETMIANPGSKVFIQKNMKLRETQKFPTLEDLTGAAAAFNRLLDTYKLNATSFARGELNGVQYDTQLSAAECYELGRQSYNKKDFYHAEVWLTAALQRQKEELNKSLYKSSVLELLSLTSFMQGNLQRALELTNEVLEINPKHEIAIKNRDYYLQEIEKASKKENNKAQDANTDQVLFKQHKPIENEHMRSCRVEEHIPTSLASKLKCRYTDKGNPFLRLARIKEEEMYLEPLILLYHDVIYDTEIETIKKISLPRLERALVYSSTSEEALPSDYQLSKVTVLTEEDHPYIAKVNRRLQDITGLSLSSGELLQVDNYGIGGHSDSHIDFSENENGTVTEFDTSSRIATFLMYMSDIPQGGMTIFNKINVTVHPVKGSAVFWYNLYPSSEGDLDTYHVECPVLVGSKWVATKWFHLLNNEFSHPCGLKPNAYWNEVLSL